MKRSYFIAALFLSACASASPSRNLSTEKKISWASYRGIESATIDGLFVVRADPLITPLELINPPESSSFTVALLAERQGFSFLTNAAMFSKDYRTSIGYMRNFENVNNPQISSKMRGFLMFNPKKAESPAIQISSKENIEAYHTVFQSHRMWTAAEGILWKKGASIYHHVGLVGVDGKSRVLFFYHPSLVDVHEMVARILELQLNLKGLLYLDGGTHGTLYLAPELGHGWNTWISIPNMLGVKAVRQ